ncbi:MAG TPA: SRPBCC family protein [Gammaproteobacteria bacterium]
MNSRLMMMLGAGIGAATMYYFDPARGRYRRALVRDQLVHTGHKARRGVGVVGRDFRNRAIGTTASVRSLFDASPVDDAVLADRVRACLGRAVTHPASIEVEVKDGVVTLSGPILEDEAPLLIDHVRGVRGVRDVHNRLEVHAEPGRIPGLQGHPRRRPGQRSAFMQANWSPTARAIGGLAGAAAALYGLNRRTPLGTMLGAGGMLLLSRAATNLEMRRLFGVGATRHAVDIQKTIHIHAPVEKVFQLWQDFESYPSFMTHVRRVRRVNDGRENRDRWRWTVCGPKGIELEFDSVVTAREENRLLAWSTESGALVQHAGRVQFQGHPDGTTTVDIKMVYNPVAGAVGHAVAWLLGADPKHQMNDDLMRMKSFLETGKAPHDAASRTHAEHRAARPAGNGSGAPRPEEPTQPQPAA